ncbi:MAG: class I SAM-dependent methyltransferase [Candidatus Binatia bacterium]
MAAIPTSAASAPRAFAAALASVVNEVTRRTPAPRDLPFFGLDHPGSATAERLERLSDLGIFRFYERVLDLAAGLGGPARWLARRRGCTVVSFDRSRERAVASRLLVVRAHLDRAVRVGVAAFESLPATGAAFTHAWSVEALGEEADTRAIFAELFRVVRPGGQVALQEWSRSRSEQAVEYVASLEAAGFRDVRAVAVASPRPDDSTIAALVRAQLVERLEPNEAAASNLVPAAPIALAEPERASFEGDRTLFQIFASRPA